MITQRALAIVAVFLTACGEPNPAAPTSPTSYNLYAIDGTPAQGDQLNLFPDGHFNRNGTRGTFAVTGSEIILTFSCPSVNSCLAAWRGTLTVRTAPQPSLLNLREDNGTGRLRQYQRGFEL